MVNTPKKYVSGTNIIEIKYRRYYKNKRAELYKDNHYINKFNNNELKRKYIKSYMKLLSR